MFEPYKRLMMIGLVVMITVLATFSTVDSYYPRGRGRQIDQNKQIESAQEIGLCFGKCRSVMKSFK